MHDTFSYKLRGKFDKTTSADQVARQLMSDYPIITDKQGNLYYYNGTFWEKTEDTFISSYAVNGGVTSRSVINDTITLCKNRNWVNGTIKWNNVTDHEMPFENGMFNIKTGAFIEHDEEDMLNSVLPHKYDPQSAAVPELWIKCLERWFYYDYDQKSDADTKEERLFKSASALQEFFGYVLLAHTKYKKALVLHGPSNCGKSQILQVMEAIVGKIASTSLPINMFNDPQARSCLIGKRLNIVAEMSRYKKIPSEDFKMIISTGDPILVNEKYVKQYSYAPSTKHAFATNHIPNVESGAVGVWNRMLLIPMLNVIPKEERDPDLITKLTSEESINGIIDWAIEGAQRLSENEGQFTIPNISQIIIDDFEFDSECGVKLFLQENLDPSEDSCIPLRELKIAYEERTNEVRAMTVRQFSRLMREAGYENIKEKRFGERTCRALFGYKLANTI